MDIAPVEIGTVGTFFSFLQILFLLKLVNTMQIGPEILPK